MLQLNNIVNSNGNNGGGGGGGGGSSLVPPGSGTWGRFNKSLGCYIEILKNIRGNTNTEYYIEFVILEDNNDVCPLYIADVVGINIINGQICDFNFGTISRSQLESELEIGKIYKYKCVINGTTRTWYSPDANGDWAVHQCWGEDCIFTDSGINVESTSGQYLNNASNVSSQNPNSYINLASFKVVNDGTEIFSFSTAAKGTDYAAHGLITISPAV